LIVRLGPPSSASPYNDFEENQGAGLAVKKQVVRVAAGRRVLAGLLVLSAAGPSATQQLILCQRAGAPDTVITLRASKQFDRTLDCIAGDFVADMTPCAPNGGYGLSAPTGGAELVGVVNRWQDYADHMGGVVSHFANASTIYFGGGFNWPDAGGLSDKWSFTVNRATGKAELKEFPEEPSHSNEQLRQLSHVKPIWYVCHEVKPRS
jgi:hypothetical protein